MVIALLALLATASADAPDPVPVWVETGDGHHLVLHRHARPGAPAVVLCHGISSNHRFWDLDEERSLARHLWEAGFDVWNMDLRGHGLAVHHPDGRRQHPDWTIDDYGTKDLPAAFAHVLQATGQPDLHYVGHSMGGMVLAVYLANHEQTPLSSAVVVGSPLDFRDPDALVGTLLGAAPAAAAAISSLPTPLGARLLARMKRAVPLSLDEVLHNPDNLDPKAESEMLRAVVSPLWKGEIEQFARVLHDDEFVSMEGLRYREALAHVTLPMLFVAGRADHVVSPDRVFSYYEAVGSPDKEFLVASVANGMHGDYGHLDLGVGDHAADDIFVPVTRWLETHP